MLDAGLSEIARFLANYRPFMEMALDDLHAIVASAEIEFHPAGSVILSEHDGPVTWWRIIHSGAVDVAHVGKVLDILGPGDTFGHAAMLSGLPPGFEARAAENTLCYRVPASVARPLLENLGNERLRASSRLPSHSPVIRLIRSATLACGPEEAISDVARQMTELDARCAVVALDEGGFGIVTDRDLRTRVLAAGLPATAPIRTVMSAPAYTVLPERLGGDVLFEMLERGIRHALVVTEDRRLVGVVDEADLFAAQSRPWFGVRRAIAHAPDAAALKALWARVPQLLLEIHSPSLKALEVARLLSALSDALVGRALALIAEDPTGPGLLWVAVGSHARRELAPGTVLRGALIVDELPVPDWVISLPERLAACGVSDRAPARTGEGWLARAGVDPRTLSVLVDRRPLWGTPERALPVPDERHRALLLEQLATRLHEYAPPTGFDEDALLDMAGRRTEQFDIRRTAIAPIVALARWGALSAGVTEGSTIDRLHAASAAGVFEQDEARTLADAFELAFQLLVDHQLAQIADGTPPDDTLITAELSGLTRGHLRDIFRAVTSTQRGLRR